MGNYVNRINILTFVLWIVLSCVSSQHVSLFQDEHCCQHDLCPFDCVRCDGTPNCYDLSDELGCSNDTDRQLLAYKKPPVFVPFVLNVVKAQLRGDKLKHAAHFPDRNCFKSSSRKNFPSGRVSMSVPTTTEVPIWKLLLNKLENELASRTTTTTEAPIWKLLLNKLQGGSTDTEVNVWEKQVTARPTTTYAPTTSPTPPWKRTVRPSATKDITQTYFIPKERERYTVKPKWFVGYGQTDLSSTTTEATIANDSTNTTSFNESDSFVKSADLAITEPPTDQPDTSTDSPERSMSITDATTIRASNTPTTSFITEPQTDTPIQTTDKTTMDAPRNETTTQSIKTESNAITTEQQTTTYKMNEVSTIEGRERDTVSTIQTPSDSTNAGEVSETSASSSLADTVTSESAETTALPVTVPSTRLQIPVTEVNRVTMAVSSDVESTTPSGGAIDGISTASFTERKHIDANYTSGYDKTTIVPQTVSALFSIPTENSLAAGNARIMNSSSAEHVNITSNGSAINQDGKLFDKNITVNGRDNYTNEVIDVISENFNVTENSDAKSNVSMEINEELLNKTVIDIDSSSVFNERVFVADQVLSANATEHIALEELETAGNETSNDGNMNMNVTEGSLFWNETSSNASYIDTMNTSSFGLEDVFVNDTFERTVIENELPQIVPSKPDIVPGMSTTVTNLTVNEQFNISLSSIDATYDVQNEQVLDGNVNISENYNTNEKDLTVKTNNSTPFVSNKSVYANTETVNVQSNMPGSTKLPSNFTNANSAVASQDILVQNFTLSNQTSTQVVVEGLLLSNNTYSLDTSLLSVLTPAATTARPAVISSRSYQHTDSVFKPTPRPRRPVYNTPVPRTVTTKSPIPPMPTYPQTTRAPHNIRFTNRPTQEQLRQNSPVTMTPPPWWRSTDSPFSLDNLFGFTTPPSQISNWWNAPQVTQGFDLGSLFDPILPTISPPAYDPLSSSTLLNTLAPNLSNNRLLPLLNTISTQDTRPSPTVLSNNYQNNQLLTQRPSDLSVISVQTTGEVAVSDLADTYKGATATIPGTNTQKGMLGVPVQISDAQINLVSRVEQSPELSNIGVYGTNKNNEFTSKVNKKLHESSERTVIVNSTVGKNTTSAVLTNFFGSSKDSDMNLNGTNSQSKTLTGQKTNAYINMFTRSIEISTEAATDTPLNLTNALNTSTFDTTIIYTNDSSLIDIPSELLKNTTDILDRVPLDNTLGNSSSENNVLPRIIGVDNITVSVTSANANWTFEVNETKPVIGITHTNIDLLENGSLTNATAQVITGTDNVSNSNESYIAAEAGGNAVNSSVSHFNESVHIVSELNVTSATGIDNTSFIHISQADNVTLTNEFATDYYDNVTISGNTTDFILTNETTHNIIIPTDFPTTANYTSVGTNDTFEFNISTIIASEFVEEQPSVVLIGDTSESEPTINKVSSNSAGYQAGSVTQPLTYPSTVKTTPPQTQVSVQLAHTKQQEFNPSSVDWWNQPFRVTTWFTSPGNSKRNVGGKGAVAFTSSGRVKDGKMESQGSVPNKVPIVRIPNMQQTTASWLNGKVLSTDKIMSWFDTVHSGVTEPPRIPSTLPTTTQGGDLQQCYRIEDTNGLCQTRSGHFKNTLDCRTFFVCIWGFLHTCACPPNTMFDDKINVCNWDYVVTC